jgi:hypothetical protein
MKKEWRIIKYRCGRLYILKQRKLDRDCGSATGILLSLLSPSILSRVTSERNIVISNSLEEAEFNRLKEFVAATTYGVWSPKHGRCWYAKKGNYRPY